MSDHAHDSHASHGHAHAAPDHVPHVTPLWVYLATWGTLVVLTAITVGVSYLNFGGANLIIALVIATIKAGVVAALFMHLLHDQRYHTMILLSGGLFLLIFVAFTMFDTEFRGRADAIEGERPADITRPFEGTTTMAAMKAKWTGAHGAASAPTTPPGQAAVAPPAEGHAGAPTASASVAPSASAAPSASGSAVPAASGSASAAASGSASAAPAASAPPSASASAHAH